MPIDCASGVGRHLHQLSEIASIGQFRLPRKQLRFHFYESSHIFCDHTYSVYTIKMLTRLLLEFVISVNHTRVF